MRIEPKLALALLMAIPLAARRDPPHARQAWLVFAASSLYLVAVGGDWMAHFRLLVPALTFGWMGFLPFPGNGNLLCRTHRDSGATSGRGVPLGNPNVM